MFDAFGPEKILQTYEPKSMTRGIVVIDNTSLGPGKGGIRMTHSATIEECFRLARLMTWKNALAELPFGGAKGFIVCDPKAISMERKKEVVQRFSCDLKPICPSQYIAGPDMNMGEQEMRWFADANGSLKSCTGKPVEMGGIPHELGSAGYGIFHAAAVACEHNGMDIQDSKIAIEGFGNVGFFSAKFFSENGATIVAISDSSGTVYDSKGLDFKTLSEAKKIAGHVAGFGGRKILSTREILTVNADILVTAAIPGLISKHDIPKMAFKIVIEGSNIPVSNDVEKSLHKKGVLVIPDFVANAGGVISSYVEHIGGTQRDMFKVVEDRIRKNTSKVLERTTLSTTPREAAMGIAMERVVG
ncbi:MAG: Glu/Leu/Phe/Val dehydrogenase [Candidatus Aenigmarchaeota archaeon]|nr:Glu/Leu/Phe/Val dehydrogenase [Candidatus Aenigmarchaeota archaeon]